MKVLQRILNLLLLPLIIFGAITLAKKMIASKPPRKAAKPKVVIARASFIEVSPESHAPIISTFGNTQSYNQTTISSQVSGEIQQVAESFNAGRTVTKGDLLVEINPADYLALISQQEAAVAEAEQVLAEEETRSRIAAEDWIDSGRQLSDASDYTLRKPQLTAAKASLSSSQSALQKARLDLERTQIRAPFDAIVSARSASPGNVVNTGADLGTLIFRGKAEVRLPLTPQQLNRITLPSPAAGTSLDATLSSPTQPGLTWQARLTRTEPSVDPQNQVLYVIAEVDDPFASDENFLPIGAFVNAEIKGNPIPNSYSLPSTALVEDSFVWMINSEDQLTQLFVERVFSEGDSFLARTQGEPPSPPLRIASRPLASFREGQTVAPTPASL